MAKGKVVDRATFLLPKMEFFQLDGTPEGFFFKELGGKALLEYKEFVEQLQNSAGENDTLQTSQALDLMAKFIVLSACNEQGNPIFDDGDLPALTEKNPALLLDMANFAMPLSGLSPQALGEVAVNLKNDQPSSSTTD
jgi:hypothetical protein